MGKKPIRAKIETCPTCEGKGKISVIATESLREMRESRGITMTEVARRLKLSLPYLSDVEKGNRQPTRKILDMYREIERQ